MTPARCGLNSSPSHTDASCNLLQFANSPRGISSVLPCYYIGYYVLLWNEPAILLLVVLVPRLGGLGCHFFPVLALEGRRIMQPVALKAHTETSSVWCRTCARGGRDLVLYCFRLSVNSPSSFAMGQHSVAG